MATGIAVCLIQNIDLGDLPIDTYYPDDVVAAEDGVSYLLERGHTRIGMIGGMHWPPSTPRVWGYRRAFQQHSLPVDEAMLLDADLTEADGYAKMQTLLRMPSPPTAVFAANDLMAIGALLAAKEAGLRVPEDIALVGFDDIPTAKLVHPPLTTISLFPKKLGEGAAMLLLERMCGEATAKGRRLLLPHRLMVRESA